MVVIRPATAADVEQITALRNARLATTTSEWTDEPHTVAEMRGWLEEHRVHDQPVVVAVGENRPAEVIGWAAYSDFRDTARWPGYRFTVEHTIHVREDAWGRGVGRLLIGALVEHARAAGRRVLIAAIDGENVESIAFHERLEFVEVGRLPGVGEKFGRRLDLVLLQLALDSPDLATEKGPRSLGTASS